MRCRLFVRAYMTHADYETELEAFLGYLNLMSLPIDTVLTPHNRCEVNIDGEDMLFLAF